MATKVPPSVYVQHLNEALKKHQLYRQGMFFRVHPENASDEHVTGTAFVGGDDLPGVGAQVQQQVNEEYEVTVPGKMGGGWV